MQQQISAPQESSSSASQSFPDAVISQLMNLGYSRDKVIRALQTAGGNVEVAAGQLFGGS